MRFFVVILVLALAIAVSAAPRNVPQLDPQSVIDFQAEQNPSIKERWLSPEKIKRSLQEAVDAWILSTQSSKFVKRGSGSSAFNLMRDWKTTAEKKFGLVPKN